MINWQTDHSLLYLPLENKIRLFKATGTSRGCCGDSQQISISPQSCALLRKQIALPYRKRSQVTSRMFIPEILFVLIEILRSV